MEGLAAAGMSDLSAAYLPVFQLLPPEGGRITDLARKAGTTKQAVGYLVAHLERQGYLERELDPSDRRSALVSRTERGWTVNRISRDVVHRVQGEWAQLLGEQEMASLISALCELVARLGAEYRGSVADVDVLDPRARRSSRGGGVYRACETPSTLARGGRASVAPQSARTTNSATHQSAVVNPPASPSP
jgi:DNA-binding MarR family transcriptional regulator